MAQTRHRPHSGRGGDGDRSPPDDEGAEIAELAVEIVREVIEAGELAREAASEGPPQPPSWASQIPGIVASQVNAMATLGPHEKEVLADLLRLHLSLQGPQGRLESGASYSRPLYPPPRIHPR